MDALVQEYYWAKIDYRDAGALNAVFTLGGLIVITSTAANDRGVSNFFTRVATRSSVGVALFVGGAYTAAQRDSAGRRVEALRDRINFLGSCSD